MSIFNVGGLSTGVDYNDLISKLIEIKRRPINILENKKSKYNEKISSYSDLSTKLSALKSAVDNLRNTNNFYAKSASVGDSTVLEVTVSNTTPVGNYSITVTDLASEEKEVHSGVASATTVVNNSGSDKVFQYTYGGTQRTLTVANGTTLNGLKDLINDDTSNPGVTATIINDGSSYRLAISGDSMGSTNTISIDAGTTLDGTGSTEDFRSTTFTETKTADDADLTVDGISITRGSNTITDVIEGMTINLYKGGLSSTVSVTADVDAISGQIGSFVSAYNDVVSFLSTNISYDSVAGVSGVLSGEGTARNIQYKFRDIISGSASGLPNDYRILAQIGITSDSKTGQLSINSTILESKLASNLDDVANIFKDTSEGVAVEIYDYITNITSTVDGSITLREEGLKDVIEYIDDTIRNMEYRLDKTEEDLVRKFTALESLVSGFNNTASFLNNHLNFSIRA